MSMPTVTDLGAMPYAEAFALQTELNTQVESGSREPEILLVEHPAVITLTPKKGVADHLLASREALAKMGVAVEETNRGGDITYHGPGQLVVYPIFNLRKFGLGLSSYMRLLEEAVIQTLAVYQVTGQRDPDATGVWVDRTQHGMPAMPIDNGHLSKICAMGVRVRKHVTLHGLALNVTTNLEHFNLIVPCGLTGRPVTSLQQLLGENAPSISTVKKDLVDNLQQCLLHARNNMSAKIPTSS